MEKLIYIVVSKETGTLQNFILEPQTNFFMAFIGNDEDQVEHGLLAPTVDLMFGAMPSVPREESIDPEMWDIGHELRQQVELEGVRIFVSQSQDEVSFNPSLILALRGFEDATSGFEVGLDNEMYEVGFSLGLEKRLENEEEFNRSN